MDCTYKHTHSTSLLKYWYFFFPLSSNLNSANSRSSNSWISWTIVTVMEDQTILSATTFKPALDLWVAAQTTASARVKDTNGETVATVQGMRAEFFPQRQSGRVWCVLRILKTWRGPWKLQHNAFNVSIKRLMQTLSALLGWRKRTQAESESVAHHITKSHVFLPGSLIVKITSQRSWRKSRRANPERAGLHWSARRHDEKWCTGVSRAAVLLWSRTHSQ